MLNIFVLFIVVISLSILMYTNYKKKKEPFISNTLQQNIYYNDSGVVPEINDIRDKIYDFHDQYNDTHSWLYTELVKGNEAVNCSTGVIGPNIYASGLLEDGVPPVDNTRRYTKKTDSGNGFSPIYNNSIGAPRQMSKTRKQIIDGLPVLQNILRIKSRNVPSLSQSGGDNERTEEQLQQKDKIEKEEKGQGIDIPEYLIERVKIVQPYILSDIEITERKGIPFYSDARYPEQLVPVGFIKDPKKYCKDHYDQYPCYRYLSKF